MEEAWSLGFRGGVAICPAHGFSPSLQILIFPSQFTIAYVYQINLHPRLYFLFDRLGEHNPKLHYKRPSCL